MDEARYIDWYPVVDAVANGQVHNHRCPECREGVLEGASDGVTVRVRCPRCGVGFEGRLGHGRDDGLYAEADRVMAAWAGRGAASTAAASTPAAATPAASTPAAATPAASTPAASTPARPSAPEEQWDWTLPRGEGVSDEAALSAWMPVVEAAYNGRRTGLACPFCSEPLTDITLRSPYLRVRCRVCGETFEGRVE